MKLVHVPFVIFLIFSTSIFAQEVPPQEGALFKPTIVEIEFPDDMSIRKKKAVSTPTEYYLKPFDETPIQLERDIETPAKLHVKGRGSLNHIKIYDEDASEDDYPVMSKTFRGVNFQEVDLSELEDGRYRVEVISPHSVSENFMEVATLGTN